MQKPQGEFADTGICGGNLHPSFTGDEAAILACGIELENYLSILDWTGRQLRADRQGTIPGHFAPILERLGVNVEGWIQTVQHFGRWFKQRFQ